MMQLKQDPRVVVAQLGARMRYAVPGQLFRRGCLARCYTDWLRFDAGIPMDQITQFRALALQYWLAQRIGSSVTRRNSHLWAGEQFNRQILASQPWANGCNVFYGFKTAALELLVSARSAGVHGILEQTSAPLTIEQRIMTDAARRWPGWENVPVPWPAYSAREREEWRQAASIVCGSEFVREGLVTEGVPAGKIHVVPYGVEPPAVSDPGSADLARVPACLHLARRNDSECTILYVGAIRLQKGIPCLLDAATRLKRPGLRFHLVGSIQCDEGMLRRTVRAPVEIIGPVPYTALGSWYAGADIFCFPSICEGSARVVYEALAMGLPVVTTPNAGSIVRDGVEGRIIPAGDVDALTDALDDLVRHPDRRMAMAQAALERARFGSEAAYGNRLFDSIRQGSGGGRGV
ncbi:MAG: hypothetical protein A2498_09290 [Lentisphaerae bacterium RIFOXYC12_FULL_60_16]|nr:MAG: hypothetical protein A2498_09290 [Lentisphaerae bacterium RIFOXYC12_FULL_60_16]